MTEQQQGGIAPEPVADATAANQADQGVATAGADEPPNTTNRKANNPA